LSPYYHRSWGEGVYLMHPALKTGIIVIHQSPQTPQTLWFRLLGKGKVQERAVREVGDLPKDCPYRQNALDFSTLADLEAWLSVQLNIK
jgi:hypothetical protein